MALLVDTLLFTRHVCYRQYAERIVPDIVRVAVHKLSYFENAILPTRIVLSKRSNSKSSFEPHRFILMQIASNFHLKTIRCYSNSFRFQLELLALPSRFYGPGAVSRDSRMNFELF